MVDSDRPRAARADHDRRYYYYTVHKGRFPSNTRGASEEPILVSRENGEGKKDIACIIIVAAPPGRDRWCVTRTGVWLGRQGVNRSSHDFFGLSMDGRTGGPWWDAVDQPTQVSLNHATMCSQPTRPPRRSILPSMRGPVVVGNKPTWMGDPLELAGDHQQHGILSIAKVSAKPKYLRRSA